MEAFLSGAIAMACWIVGLFFLRFWRRTRDRLFMLFAMAFWIMSLNRIGMVFVTESHESRTYLYCVRLLAFVMIALAIFDKNRAARR